MPIGTKLDNPNYDKIKKIKLLHNLNNDKTENLNV